VVEHLLVAVWRAPTVSLDACRSRVLGEWVPEAVAHEALRTLTVSLAEDDQGAYAREPDAHGLVPTVDVVCRIGLERAHDLDDIPARDLFHPFARRVEAWRVDLHRPLTWERTWPDGERAPGVKMVSFMRRADGLTHQQFVRHWTERHAPLARRHHVGLWNYTQNVVRRAYTPGGGRIDGIAELHFRSRADFEERFFDSDEGRAVIMEDVRRFMGPPGPETALMSELPVRTDDAPGR
jgi:uncharacterized protein (TIGR02118 family)